METLNCYFVYDSGFPGEASMVKAISEHSAKLWAAKHFGYQELTEEFNEFIEAAVVVPSPVEW